MKNSVLNNLLRQLPAIQTILISGRGKELVGQYGHELVAEASAAVLGLWRKKIATDMEGLIPQQGRIIQEIEDYLVSFTRPRLRRVINATGIILHTNLGRALLAEKARQAILEAGTCYSNLEYNLTEGVRGSRHSLVEDLLVHLTGAQSAMVVNNNAAAILLVMNTLAAGREAVVSRGELVEIGGSFRIPDVLKIGGVKLHEVGTTNRTHLADYKKALGPETGMILKVHTSNYRIVGFTKAVGSEELLGLAQTHNLPLVQDLGSGSLLDLTPFGLKDETLVPQVLAKGVDVVTFSGDKLLGGPQAGIIVGRKKYLDAMKTNHLARALRVDKLTLAALEATLREYLNPAEALTNIPIYRMLTMSLESLEEMAKSIAAALSLQQDKVQIRQMDTRAQIGAGTLPAQDIPSRGVALTFQTRSLSEVEQALRQLPVPIIGYIENGQYILDMRTLLPGDMELISAGISSIIN